LSKPFDRILTIDFETRWDKRDYTLSKMTTEEYIRDKRFISFGACVHEYGSADDIKWIRGSDLPEFFSGSDWGRTAVLAHNAQFDVSIMEWIYGARPAFIFDTLSMARALRGVEVGNSLAKLAGDFNLPPKGTAVHSTDGMAELDALVESELADYCKHDVYLCERIFDRLVKGYPKSELRLIDMTLKMYTRPTLELDQQMLIKALTEEGELREGLLQRLGIQETSLASNPQFADILQSLGVAPPTKVSKTTGKQTLALAKNDALFQALLNGEREDVALLCEARLRVKSTTERTRAQRFLDISQRGKLPVPLSYYGALSGRWTAAKGSAINMQNLKRGSFLRKAIMAPEGHSLVVGDLSQIEPRVLAWLSDYQEMLDIFRAGGDPYAAFGAQMFNIPGLTKESHPDLRQSAKSALLGCGYGLGWSSFASQLLTGFLGAPPQRYDKAFAKTLGVDQAYAQKFVDWEDNVTKMLEIPHTCTDQELLTHCLAAKKIIDIYRATAHPVATFWDMCSNLIESSLYGGKVFQYKCLTFSKERIELPNGMSLLYPQLRREKDEKGRSQWVYGPNATKLYAGKVTNNVTQAVARIVMTDGMLRVSKKYPVVGTVHDEQIVVVPDAEVDDAKTWVLAQMTMQPNYMPGIPLAADGGAHRRYGLAKN
jgi:DNA polymerase III epsilon subunit-like protein